MLGILLLGTEILLVSAVWRESYVTTSDTCSALSERWENETIIPLNWTKDNDLYVSEVHESGHYDVSVLFDLGEVSDRLYLLLSSGPACFGVHGVRIWSHGEEGTAEVLLDTELGVLVGGVSTTFPRCSWEECMFHFAAGLMETAPLKYSPLTEDFWTTFNGSNIFNEAWIQRMNIHTIVGNIQSQWVSHLSTRSLQSLSLSGNNWTRPGKLLGFLPSLLYLGLIDNNIEVMSNDTFSGTPRLKQLLLSGNRLLHLPFGFENLKNRLKFYLENQRRSVFQISDHDLPSLNSMNSIKLTNVTVRIDLCNISELVNLRSITVDNSRILRGGEEQIYCTGSIESITGLTLRQNNLSVLPSNLMKGMTNIEDLDVRGNHLTDCQGNVLGKLRKLSYLVMSSNRLRNLTADCFHTLEDLIVLRLSNNEIVSIEEGTFVDLVNLFHLDLSRNKLVSIERGTFFGLINLDILDLSFNKLINIHYTVFLPVYMEELLQPLVFEKVVLSNNKLSEVNLRSEAISTITSLDLSNNSIRKIEVGNVEGLNLSYNSLDHIPDGVVTIPEGLESLDFGGNNLACCHPNNVMLTNSTVTIYNLATSEPFYCFLNDEKIILQTNMFNSSYCVSDSTFSEELWASLGVFTAVTAVFMSFVYYYRAELAYLGLFAKILKKGMRTDEQKYTDAAYDAFVCYCGKNLVWVIRQLLGSIEGTDEKYRVCIHDRDFTLGGAIYTNVLTALDKSRKVIFVLSPDFMSSKWCRWELEMATLKMFDEERHYIILIELESLEGVVLPKPLKYLMKSRTYLRWPGDSASEEKTAKFWEELRQALGPSIFRKTKRRLPMISVLDIRE